MGIKQPPAYVHPKKRKREEQSLEPQTPKKTDGSDLPKKKKKVAQFRPEAASVKTEQFRLVIYPPVTGQIAIYDEMIKSGFTPKRALLGLMKKEFSQFEAELLAGNISRPTDDLKSDGKPIDTTRNVSPQFIKAAKTAFDVFEVLSKRALGRCVAEAVLRMVDQHRK